MSDSPDRIWARPNGSSWDGFGFWDVPDLGGVEYVRADLAQRWQHIEVATPEPPYLSVRASWFTPENGNHRWVFSRITEVRECDEPPNGQTHWMPIPTPPEGVA